MQGDQVISADICVNLDLEDGGSVARGTGLMTKWMNEWVIG